MRTTILKSIRIFLLTTTLVAVQFSCTNDFERINVNPTGVLEDRINEDILFTRSLLFGALRYTEFQRAHHLYANHYIQYYATSVERFETDRYITRNDWLTSYWAAAYADFGMQCQQVINITAKNENKINKTAIARIWKVFIMHRITDLWGDVPYTEAFSGKVNPAFDRQELIYEKMLTELKEAVSQFDVSKPLRFSSADLLYGGDLNAWIRFANSLRLRLAMRISKANPQLAEQQVRDVFADGRLISANDQSATMPYGRDFGNAAENIQPMSLIRGFNEYRASNTLVDFLQNNNDPRLPMYIEPVNGQYIGLQNGLSPEALDAINPNDYSKESQIISNPFAPTGLLLYPEILFLESEAILKGWHEGSAQEKYEAGVRASIAYWIGVRENLLARVPAAANSIALVEITEQEISDYLQEPAILFSPGSALQQIITQKWLANINQGFEAYNDYRRTGFPVLNPIPNSDGLSETGSAAVPRRLRYPAEEQSLNRVNYNQAVQQQGPDAMTTRIWWDRP